MNVDQERKLQHLVYAFGLLQLQLADESAGREEIEANCRDIERQAIALQREIRERKDHTEKIEVQLKQEIQRLRRDLAVAESKAVDSTDRASRALQDARQERFKRHAIEDENRLCYAFVQAGRIA
jgi:predicted phage gp36 major capsid-like protein